MPQANDIQNIDPTVLVDDDGRVYIYWGTFGQLRGMELARDMVTPASPEHIIEGLTGFFEAPWLMKRKGIYYMLYAGNNAGPDSPCTPAVYHACQAYGTAPSPLGPWTWRGVVLPARSNSTGNGIWPIIPPTPGMAAISVGRSRSTGSNGTTAFRPRRSGPSHRPARPCAMNRRRKTARSHRQKNSLSSRYGCYI